MLRAAPPARLRAREAAARRRRGRLVELQRAARRLVLVAGTEGLVHRVGLGTLPLGLELRETLGRELAGVLLLDALEPLGARGLLGGVDLDALRLRVLVDLLEQLVDE